MTEQFGPSDQQGAYPAAFFQHLLAVEDHHFWFRGRNYLITRLARKLTRRLNPPYRVLEVGCGNGNVLRYLARACAGATVIGMDLFEEGLRFARQRAACPVVQASAGRAPFSIAFDLVGIFDVLEHTPDDLQVLREIKELLAPGGVLLITVPAGKSLWSYFDILSGHHRRYELPDLATKLNRVGLRLEFASHYMATLYPLARLVRSLRERHNRNIRIGCDVRRLLRREFAVMPLLNGAFTLALRAEAIWISRGFRLPFGTSLIAVARRAESAAC